MWTANQQDRVRVPRALTIKADIRVQIGVISLLVAGADRGVVKPGKLRYPSRRYSLPGVHRALVRRILQRR
jgi:hypothetical protein